MIPAADNINRAMPSTSGSSFFVPDEEIPVHPQAPPAKAIENNHELDTHLANEIARLSMEERDEVLRDIHGVADHVDESPEFIARNLLELEHALEKIRRKDAFNLAKSISSEYVNNEKFRLAFLRAGLFDVEKAADRMVRHFETKLDLFGPEVLARDITMDDLDEDDMICLRSRVTHVLPVRDSSGRAISCWAPGLRPNNCPLRAKLRGWFYGAMLLLWDEETQKKGSVLVVYLTGTGNTDIDRSLAWNLPSTSAAIPLRSASVHLCIDGSTVHPLVALSLRVIGRYARLRIRFHFGTINESVLTSIRCWSVVQFTHYSTASLFLH
jgi:hypothetical protein